MSICEEWGRYKFWICGCRLGCGDKMCMMSGSDRVLKIFVLCYRWYCIFRVCVTIVKEGGDWGCVILVWASGFINGNMWEGMIIENIVVGMYKWHKQQVVVSTRWLVMGGCYRQLLFSVHWIRTWIDVFGSGCCTWCAIRVCGWLSKLYDMCVCVYVVYEWVSWICNVFVEIVFFIMFVWCARVLYIGDYEYLVVLFLWYYNHDNIGGGPLFVRVI